MANKDNTRIGRKWELWAAKYIFHNSKVMFYNNMCFDLLDDETKIDIKSSKLRIMKHGKYFQFKIKYNTGADYFLCIGYIGNRDKNPYKVWRIPACLVSDRYQIYIGPNNRIWKEFEIDISHIRRAAQMNELPRQEHKTRMKLYKQKLDDNAIGKLCNVTKEAIVYWRKINGLPSYSKPGRKKLSTDENQRRISLYNQGLRGQELADAIGISYDGAKTWLLNYNRSKKVLLNA